MEQVVHVVVRGRVQGVGFRYHAETVARRHGVAGWVRNLPTGEVEILARLDEARKAGFLAEIRQGPPAARVTGMEVWPSPHGMTPPAAGFSVRF